MISIVIPAYNCANTINHTITCILFSGLTNYEIIIVDDGSIDGTAEVCDMLVQAHPCIRCIHQKNAGVSAARNRGLREATGEYVWFFDADDSVKEGSMEPIERILRDKSPDMLVFGIEFDYYHKGKIYRRDEKLPPVEGMKNAAECSAVLYELFLSNSLSSLCTRMIKKCLLSDSSIQLREDMILYEDLEFVLRVQRYCSSVCFYPEAIYLYRQSEDEGNAGRRLQRIPHIPEMLARISESLDGQTYRDEILLALYLTLAREKIYVSGIKEIETICSDFRSWIDEKSLRARISQREYPMMIYNGQVFKITAKRAFSKTRHRAANWLKQTIGDFRKW